MNLQDATAQAILNESNRQREKDRMKQWVSTVLENKVLEESSMSKIAEYISYYQVGFITAFRQGRTKAQNQDKNYELKLDIIQDLDKLNLSYLKVDGTYPEVKIDDNGIPIDGEFTQIFEETFCIINDRYRSDNFIEIMCALCGKYEQDSVLIVFPPADNQKKIEANIVACEYNKDGNIVATYKGFTVSAYDKYKDRNPKVQDYYTKIGNKKLSFTNRKEFNEDYGKEPEFDVLTYRLKKHGNLGSMLGARQRSSEVERVLNALKIN